MVLWSLLPRTAIPECFGHRVLPLSSHRVGQATYNVAVIPCRRERTGMPTRRFPDANFFNKPIFQHNFVENVEKCYLVKGTRQKIVNNFC